MNALSIAADIGVRLAKFIADMIAAAQARNDAEALEKLKAILDDGADKLRAAVALAKHTIADGRAATDAAAAEFDLRRAKAIAGGLLLADEAERMVAPLADTEK